jgi:hypothetical protein
MKTLGKNSRALLGAIQMNKKEKYYARTEFERRKRIEDTP